DDRDEVGQGFTHHVDDIVRISSPRLGTLVNRVRHSESIEGWPFGIGALLSNLAARGLLGRTRSRADCPPQTPVPAPAARPTSWPPRPRRWPRPPPAPRPRPGTWPPGPGPGGPVCCGRWPTPWRPTVPSWSPRRSARPGWPRPG